MRGLYSAPHLEKILIFYKRKEKKLPFLFLARPFVAKMQVRSCRKRRDRKQKKKKKGTLPPVGDLEVSFSFPGFC